MVGPVEYSSTDLSCGFEYSSRRPRVRAHTKTVFASAFCFRLARRSPMNRRWIDSNCRHRNGASLSSSKPARKIARSQNASASRPRLFENTWHTSWRRRGPLPAPLSSRWPCHGHADRYGRGERPLAPTSSGVAGSSYRPLFSRRAGRGPNFPCPSRLLIPRAESAWSLSEKAGHSRTRLVPCARALRARGPSRTPSPRCRFGLRNRGLRTRVRAAASSERERAGRRRAHQLAGAGASVARASRGRLTRGTAPANQRRQLRASALTRLRILDLRARSRLAPRPGLRRGPRPSPAFLFRSRSRARGAAARRCSSCSCLARRVPRARTEDACARTCSRTTRRTSACQAFSSESSPPARWPSAARPKYVGFAYVKVASATRRPRGDHLGTKRRGK